MDQIPQNSKLFTPGPTTIPPEVQLAISQPILYHKSSEFEDLMLNVQNGLQYVFSTNQIVLSLSCSATGTAEAVISSLHKSGDKIVVLNNGRFANRWREMLEVFGITVVNYEIQWGESPSVEQVKQILAIHQDIKAIWLVHCETSTGAVADIKALSEVIHNYSDALICVDGVSSVGALECQMDNWGIDALICCSQKALMTPPGLGFVALSRRAWDIVERKKSSSYYFDLLRVRSAIEKNRGVFTPAVGLLMGLNEALNSIKYEKLENVISRHKSVATIIRNGMSACNLEALPTYPSNSLTVVKMSDSNKLITALKKEFGIIVADGQELLSGKSMRIGHFGYIFDEDAHFFVDCLKKIQK